LMERDMDLQPQQWLVAEWRHGVSALEHRELIQRHNYCSAARRLGAPLRLL